MLNTHAPETRESSTNETLHQQLDPMSVADGSLPFFEFVARHAATPETLWAPSLVIASQVSPKCGESQVDSAFSEAHDIFTGAVGGLDKTQIFAKAELPADSIASIMGPNANIVRNFFICPFLLIFEIAQMR
jgi:hypothetical protein